MPLPKALQTTQTRRETAIEDAVMAHPEVLGFPGALAVRNCRVPLPTGRVDVVLLPVSGPVRLVLVEAKVAGARDAASKVVGQLLMYYAGALMLGSNGVEALRALEQPTRRPPGPSMSRPSMLVSDHGVFASVAESLGSAS